jgi:hypothetical protein
VVRRRQFIQDSFMAAAGTALLSSHGIPAYAADNLVIQYIREKIPAFEIPPYRGERYKDQVPDTLDIAERALLGINCLTGITDPLADREIFWFADFHRNPPVMVHDFSDWCQNVEGMMESLTLLRALTGSDLNSNVDKIWMETLLKSIGPDGLVYVPLGERPWGRLNHAWMAPVWRANGTTTDASDKTVAQITGPALWPRSISAMIIYYLRDSNPIWTQAIEKMIEGMSALASDEGDYIFFPAGGYEPNKKFTGGLTADNQLMPTGYLALDGGNIRVIQGLAQYYRLSGYEPAKTLAGKLVNFARFHADAYDRDGRFRFSAYEKIGPEWFVEYSHAHGGQVTLEQIKGQTLGGHFHSHAVGILGMIDYAAAVGDRELLDWCQASYVWARMQGNSLTGFFPEYIVPSYPSCESCGVADMIAIAAKLSQAGAGDYWDDLDRWVRNQFAENQLTKESWIYHLAESSPEKPVAFNETDHQVGKRNLGGFAGWASGNEWSLKNGIMHCCTGNSTRALYYVWENIVEGRNQEFRINLLLNRASAWADVYSFIPYEGRVRIKMKKSCPRVVVRMPEWLKSGSSDPVCKVKGGPRALTWEGRYVIVGGAESGETIDLTFPIATRTVGETVGAVRYTMEVRGNTVISIDPGGRTGPLYERSYQPMRWLTVDRFVTEREIVW